MVSHGPASADSPDLRPNLILIGCSRGGLSALTAVLSAMPADLPAAIVVVQHLSAHFASRLAEILQGRTPLSVQQAAHGTRPRNGTVYVAPPDQHVTIDRLGRIRLDRTAKVNFSRPAIDRLFLSAASHVRNPVIAVLLSGYGSDGVEGAAAVQRAGGTVIVQDEESADDFGIAGAAIAAGCVDRVLPANAIGTHLSQLVMGQ